MKKQQQLCKLAAYLAESIVISDLNNYDEISCETDIKAAQISRILRGSVTETRKNGSRKFENIVKADLKNTPALEALNLFSNESHSSWIKNRSHEEISDIDLRKYGEFTKQAFVSGIRHSFKNELEKSATIFDQIAILISNAAFENIVCSQLGGLSINSDGINVENRENAICSLEESQKCFTKSLNAILENKRIFSRDIYEILRINQSNNLVVTETYLNLAKGKPDFDNAFKKFSDVFFKAKNKPVRSKVRLTATEKLTRRVILDVVVNIISSASMASNIDLKNVRPVIEDIEDNFLGFSPDVRASSAKKKAIGLLVMVETPAIYYERLSKIWPKCKELVDLLGQTDEKPNEAIVISAA